VAVDRDSGRDYCGECCSATWVVVAEVLVEADLEAVVGVSEALAAAVQAAAARVAVGSGAPGAPLTREREA